VSFDLGAYMKADAGLNLANPPSIQWASDDSESSASSGSMKISVTFDSYGQYVDPVINLPSVVDLSSRQLTMKVRLVSGTFMAWSQGGVQFHFSTTSSYTYSAGMWIDSTTFTNNSWKVTSIDTATAVPATAGAMWDPTQVIQIGVQFLSGFSGGGTFVDTGDTVFEIDTVTD